MHLLSNLFNKSPVKRKLLQHLLKYWGKILLFYVVVLGTLLFHVVTG